MNQKSNQTTNTLLIVLSVLCIAILGYIVIGTVVGVVSFQDVKSSESTTYTMDSRKTIIPAECTSFFDGCNTCSKMENGTPACTLMACETYEKPKCIDDEIQKEGEGTPTATGETIGYTMDSRRTMIPKECKAFFDGCNTCTREGEGAKCTEMVCSKYEKPKCIDNEDENAEAEADTGTVKESTQKPNAKPTNDTEDRGEMENMNLGDGDERG